MKNEALVKFNVVRPLMKTDHKRALPANTGGSQSDINKDHYMEKDGRVFAGSHLIIDCYGAKRLDDLSLMDTVLRECVEKSLATLLHIHLHHFTSSGGISGVAVLAESHISVHTWPEREFAAFDIFMCGKAKPEESIPVIKRAFAPRTIKISEILRGVNHDA
ncbi:MAG: adenosylmethionine decarboxylase [Deltaproteobacteria bacterium]|nr:adenosylmethionine decarboxylase [Deltaproteobacteria bacterium]